MRPTQRSAARVAPSRRSGDSCYPRGHIGGPTRCSHAGTRIHDRASVIAPKRSPHAHRLRTTTRHRTDSYTTVATTHQGTYFNHPTPRRTDPKEETGSPRIATHRPQIEP